MALRFIGIDPNTSGGNCPTVFVDETTGDMVFQGWRADEATLTECRQTGAVPETEAVIRIPARMAAMVKEAADVAERRGL